MPSFKARQIAENVWWVGAIDWNLREFHGYRTGRGSTYNAYLVIDEKITLIDTVKAPFFEEMRDRIASVIDPEKIDYIVSNHSEMDHSGGFVRAVKEFKVDKVYCSMQGERALQAHFHGQLPLEAVKHGSDLSLGKNSLHFLETRLLHWPDSMFSYLTGDNVLFSQDAFGMHMAGSALFADEYSEEVLREEAASYYANILQVQTPLVAKLLETVPQLELNIDIIAPDHGPVWRNSGVGRILNWYSDFAVGKSERRAVIVYDTMWHSTEKMAHAVAEGISNAGWPVEVIALKENDRSLAVARAFKAGLLVLGSPTLNNNIYPALADFMTYFRGLKGRTPFGGAFGSYGWSGEAPKHLAQMLTDLKIEQPLPPMSIRYVPDAQALEDCRNWGEALAKAADPEWIEAEAETEAEAAETQTIEETKPMEKMYKYVCDICGYTYDPAVGDPDSCIPPNTPWEAVPPNWVCPKCGADKNDFSKSLDT